MNNPAPPASALSHRGQPRQSEQHQALCQQLMEQRERIEFALGPSAGQIEPGFPRSVTMRVLLRNPQLPGHLLHALGRVLRNRSQNPR